MRPVTVIDQTCAVGLSHADTISQFVETPLERAACQPPERQPTCKDFRTLFWSQKKLALDRAVGRDLRHVLTQQELERCIQDNHCVNSHPMRAFRIELWPGYADREPFHLWNRLVVLTTGAVGWRRGRSYELLLKGIPPDGAVSI
eukprot:scaffold136219_cov33-Tisochrysis_lutea.AAC.2